MMQEEQENKIVNFEPNGKFAKGNRMSVGVKHPAASEVWQLRDAMYKAITPDMMMALTLEMFDVAMMKTNSHNIASKLKAAELLRNWLLGKPKENVEITANATNTITALDADDLMALDKMRRKLTTEPPDIIVAPDNTPSP